jgi:hypothetical protein
MKTRLAACVVLGGALVAVAAWALAQPVKAPAAEKGASERKSRPRIIRDGSRMPSEPFLIDDVDPARRIPVKQAGGEDESRPPRVRAVSPVLRGPAGRYTVVVSEEVMVLVDTTVGSTWVLCPAASGNPADAVWLPIRRIDDKDEASLWKAHQRELKEKAGKGAERKRR